MLGFFYEFQLYKNYVGIFVGIFFCIKLFSLNINMLNINYDILSHRQDSLSCSHMMS